MKNCDCEKTVTVAQYLFWKVILVGMRLFTADWLLKDAD